MVFWVFWVSGGLGPCFTPEASSYRPKMDYRSLVIVRDRHLTMQGKDVKRNEEEEWLWDALRLQKVASDMGEGESALKISPAS